MLSSSNSPNHPTPPPPPHSGVAHQGLDTGVALEKMPHSFTRKQETHNAAVRQSDDALDHTLISYASASQSECTVSEQLKPKQYRNLDSLEKSPTIALTDHVEQNQKHNGKKPSRGRSHLPLKLPSFHSLKRSRSHSPKPNRTNSHRFRLPSFSFPVKDFPNQGCGKDSEFNQDFPLWSKQPYKYMYYAYFGLSIGFFYLPYWSIANIAPSKRGCRDWSWKKATMVKLYRHGTKLTFRTHTNLGRDLSKEIPHSKTARSKFCWVDPISGDDICGELNRAMKIQGIQAIKTCGFWFGQSQGGASPTQKASPQEKVLYHLHGGAYWIGTAHESDVSAAINTQSLKFLDEIYKSREHATTYPEQGASSSATASTSPSSSESTMKASAQANGNGEKKRLLRTFSLDYRLCVPGEPQAGSYPAALLDALAGYFYLVRTCGYDPENIIVTGDSAGGNLALALCRYLRDEKVEKMPGSLLLLSPWSDVSRSHAGPTGAPNLISSVYKNRKSDIISPCLAFRNTAVSAFLGNLPAKETYCNPYLSSISLQLSPEMGGQAPHWGFQGFPKRIYITTGSAEISYDQHLTLAHRLAAGTKCKKPIYFGDKLSKGTNIEELATRRMYPRPKKHQLPSSVLPTPALTTSASLVATNGDVSYFPGTDKQHFEASLNDKLNTISDSPDPTIPVSSSSTSNLLDPTPTNELGKPSLPRSSLTLPITGTRRRAMSEASSFQHLGVTLNEPLAHQENLLEDRQVILDEVKDAIHDYLLFPWFEPERSTTWRRIAQWIDNV